MTLATRSAVRIFQERQGLPINGLVGPETERALADTCKTESPPTPTAAPAGPESAADTQPGELPWAPEAEWESGPVSRRRRRTPSRPAFSSAASPGTTTAFDSQAFRQQIVRIANQELARWGNGSVKETDPRVRQVLQTYWKTGTGNSYSEAQLGNPAFQNDHHWSAAFISWVMKTAGTGDLFKSASMHSVYTRWAKDNRLANNDNPFKAYRISELAPQVGDVVCKRRAGSGATYDNIRPGMKTHCDIVTEVRPGRLITVGGNVNNSVAQKVLRMDANGFIVDPDYFAVIRIGGTGPSTPGITPPKPLPSGPGSAPKLLKQESTPPGTTLYVSIDLGIVDKFGITAAPMTGIFIPEGYQPGAAVDVILYLHGHKGEQIRRQAIDQYWNRQRFPYAAFREGVNASKRNVILVAPTLGSHSEAGRLLRAGGLDAYLDQVRAALHAYGPHSRTGAIPGLSNLILACHSGGGSPMRRLAGGQDRAVARIRESWGFDCTYNRGDDTFWAGWARARTKAKVYIYYIPGSPTAPLAESLRDMRVPNAIVLASKDRRHNYVPITHWQQRLGDATFLRGRTDTTASVATTFSKETETIGPEFSQVRWTEEIGASALLDFTLATKQNRRYAESLGWKQHIDQIVKLLGFTNMTPSEQTLAEATARWQGSRGLKTDGIIGPNTWKRMQVELKLKASPLPPRPRVHALCPPPQGMAVAEQTALALTTRFETGTPFGCVVSATDGISMGMLQWNLLAGTLQDKLATFEKQTGRLQAFFGPETERVRRLLALRGTRRSHETAVREALDEKLATRWRDLLLRLCADPTFCGLLMIDVLQRMKRAREATKQLDLKTVRGLCMLFDIEVGDGYGKKNHKLVTFAAQIKRREADSGRALSEPEKLVEIADQAARFAGQKWGAERRARRMLIAKGTGRYRGSDWNLDRDFPNLDSVWEGPSLGQSPAGPTVPGAAARDIVSVRGIRVMRQIAPRIEALLGAAQADGVKLGGWGYRSRESQIALRQKHCGNTDYDIYKKPSSQCTPPTARPGASMHEKGAAIDFTYNEKGIGDQSNPGFQWLSRNAARFGLYNLPSEPWHWSINGK